jgi:hypothetical protein
MGLRKLKLNHLEYEKLLLEAKTFSMDGVLLSFGL